MPDRSEFTTTRRLDIAPDLDGLNEKSPAPPSSSPPTRVVMARLGDPDFHELLQSIYDGAIITDLSGRILDLNMRAEQLLRTPRSDLLDHSIVAVISGARESLIGTVIEALSERRHVLLQAYCPRGDSALFPAEVTVNKMHISVRELLCFFIRDITLRKETEAQLQADTTAIENAGSGIAIVDDETRIEYVNPALLALWGYDDTGQVHGKPIGELVTQREITSRIRASLDAGSPWSGEIQCCRHDGSPFFVKAAASPNVDAEGVTVGAVYSFTDITELKSREHELQEYREHLEEEVKRRTEDLTRTNIRLEQEVRDRVSAEKKTEDTRNYLEAIILTSHDGICVIDSDGRYEYANDAFIDIMGWPREEMIGAHFVKVIPADRHDFMFERWAEVQRGEGKPYETDIVTKENERRTLLVSHKDMAFQGQRKYCLVIKDITARKKSENKLRRAISRLEEHDEARTQFVSNVSHELRTPLTSINYAVENLLKGVMGPMSDKIRKYIRMIEEDCHRLTNTITDILDLTRIESNSLVLNLAKVPVSLVVRWAVTPLRVQARAKGIALDVDVASGAGFVECDVAKMERVIANIVGNAIKYTREGGHVRVALRSAPELPDQRFIDVTDDGIGIPEKYLARVTERYFRIGEHVGGTGLGLAISREITELHGGALSITSPPQGQATGTRVTVSLPVVEPPTLLCVDDEEVVRQTLERALSSAFRVSSRADGESALQAMRDETPAIVVLDMNLPDMDGAEVILHMKADAGLRGVPVLLVTGGELDGAKQSILDGFNIPVLTKPWDLDTLMGSVEKAFMMSDDLQSEPSTEGAASQI